MCRIGMQGLRCIFPTNEKPAIDCIEVKEHDLAKLDEGEYLNDTGTDLQSKQVDHTLVQSCMPRPLKKLPKQTQALTQATY